MIRLIPYFNSTILPATPNCEWEPTASHRVIDGGYEDTDRLVRSELDYEALYSGHIESYELERVFRAMNADNRPNGRRERSLSVGDMIAVVLEGNPAPQAVWRVTSVGFQEQRPIPAPILADVRTSTTNERSTA